MLWAQSTTEDYIRAAEFKPQVSAKDRGVEKCIQADAAPCFSWSKWPHTVHGQSALCFGGFMAELKVDSWSETTLQQLLQDWLSVMWTSTFHVLFTTMDFIFCKSGVLLFLHHQDTVSYWILVSSTLCPIRCLKNVQHCGQTRQRKKRKEKYNCQFYLFYHSNMTFKHSQEQRNRYKARKLNRGHHHAKSEVSNWNARKQASDPINSLEERKFPGRKWHTWRHSDGKAGWTRQSEYRKVEFLTLSKAWKTMYWRLTSSRLNLT